MPDLTPPPLPEPKPGFPLKELPLLPVFKEKKSFNWKALILIIVGVVLVMLLLWWFSRMIIPPIPHLGFTAGTPVTNVNSTSVRVSYSVTDEQKENIPLEFWLNNDRLDDGTWTAESGKSYYTDLELPYQEYSEIRLIATDKYGNKGQSTLTIKYQDVRAPQILAGIIALGPSPCITHAHVEPLPCPPTYLYEEVWSEYTTVGGSVFNHTVKPGKYDADFWSNKNITKVYLELGCWNFNNQNITFKLTANKPGNFTEITYWSQPKNATNYTSSLKAKSWVKWC
jgi:hypothetical protein